MNEVLELVQAATLARAHARAIGDGDCSYVKRLDAALAPFTDAPLGSVRPLPDSVKALRAH